MGVGEGGCPRPHRSSLVLLLLHGSVSERLYLFFFLIFPSQLLRSPGCPRISSFVLLFPDPSLPSLIPSSLPFPVCLHQYFSCDGQISDMSRLDASASPRWKRRPEQSVNSPNQPGSRQEFLVRSQSSQTQPAERLLNADISQRSAPLSRY